MESYPHKVLLEHTYWKFRVHAQKLNHQVDQVHSSRGDDRWAILCNGLRYQSRVQCLRSIFKTYSSSYLHVHDLKC